MEKLTHSKHAHARAQQRAIPPLILEWLISYGAAERDNHGAEICYFDHLARRRLGREFGKQVVARMGAWLNAYAVISSSGTVITTGHRVKRLIRH